jgi:hypothetical protein
MLFVMKAALRDEVSVWPNENALDRVAAVGIICG